MMGHLPIWSPQPAKAPRPWHRRRTRRWVRTGDIATVGMMFAAIPSLPRAELTRLTTRMIDRMDEIDGDPDLELTGEDDEESHDCEKEEAHD